MKRILRIAAIATTIVLSGFTSYAGDESAKPATLHLPLIGKSIAGLNQMLVSNPQFNDGTVFPPGEKASTRKICVCQILNMKSNNFDHSNMVLLAEKTNNGDVGSDAGSAKTALEMEKKHLRTFFYDKIKVSQMLVDGTDCKTMFRKLSAENGELVLYEILNADIQREN